MRLTLWQQFRRWRLNRDWPCALSELPEVILTVGLCLTCIIVFEDVEVSIPPVRSVRGGSPSANGLPRVDAAQSEASEDRLVLQCNDVAYRALFGSHSESGAGMCRLLT